MDYHFENKEDIKLIILTVIKDFKIPVPGSSIVDTVCTHSLAEYFDIQQYIYELTESGLITYYIEDDVRYYSLTENGKDVMNYFSSNIPFSVREKLLKTSKENAKKLRDGLSINADYSKENETDYAVNLKIVDGAYDLISLCVNVGSESVAKAMCAKFKKNAETVYTEIFKLLTDSSSEN